MSGGVDKTDLSGHEDETGLVEEAMKLFSVDEETAKRIVGWVTVLAKRNFDKWQNNYIERVMKRLEEKGRDWIEFELEEPIKLKVGDVILTWHPDKDGYVYFKKDGKVVKRKVKNWKKQKEYKLVKKEGMR